MDTINTQTTQNSKAEETLRSDTLIMLQYAMNKGLEVPSGTTLHENDSIDKLIADYNALCKVIEPANIESIKYINAKLIQNGRLRKWYEIPVFKKCMFIAIVALIILIGVSLLEDVNIENQQKGLLNSHGMVLFVNLIFICSASLLGVMFYILKNLGQKIKQYTFLQVDALELDASIIIGVISGFVVSELFLFTIADLQNDYFAIQKMTLALLGGFSSDAIFSILQDIVKKFKNILS